MTARTKALGRIGEQLAEAHLTRLGARILGRNVRSDLGELDLLIEHEGDLVGVEVKTRRAGQASLPEEAVGPRKIARLEQLLAQSAARLNLEERGWRIDVVAIEVDASGAVTRLEHIRDAYG